MNEARGLVLGLPGSGALPAQLAQALGWACVPLFVRAFPDGESLVRIDAAVAGRCVILAGSLDRPEGKTLPLLFAADCARELGATQVGLVAPYLAYMRQDARFHPGEAISSLSYARLLSRALDFLLTVDPHLHRHTALSAIYSIPAVAVAAAPAIAQWIVREVPSPLIVGPDEESAQWVAQVAQAAGAPWAVLRKQRQGDREVLISAQGLPPAGGCTPVLVDDIVSSGATLAGAARLLRGAGHPAPVAVVVHALMDEAAGRGILEAGVSRLVSCDAVPHPSNAIALLPAIVQGLAPLLEAA
ncbi:MULTISPECIES: ribose-phosphate diphosphokinase [Ramlibacter]|uniref:Ribose-phosphate diphosphokinase n=1 Tax=Ramlibacter aquaticus TaxID=2780094 RepID=A0ABR9SBD1_9BURK|nr:MULTISPECIES: ribose-phosphate diphosphokinase [Ramlibacter]MBE7939656.1 ribose-phosphate diphosphokinase [Ramlibacter aquaticus]